MIVGVLCYFMSVLYLFCWDDFKNIMWFLSVICDAVLTVMRYRLSYFSLNTNLPFNHFESSSLLDRNPHSQLLCCYLVAYSGSNFCCCTVIPLWVVILRRTENFFFIISIIISREAVCVVHSVLVYQSAFIINKNVHKHHKKFTFLVLLKLIWCQ